MYTLRITTKDSRLIIRKKTAEIKVGASVKRGLKGDTGPQGPQGIQGEPGTTDYNELTNLPDLTLKADITYVDSQDTSVASTAQSNLTAHTSNTSNPHSVTKAQVGLGNVENLAPADMPVSTAQAAALALKANANATVNLTGDQTIAGVKTFTSAPIAPSGTSIGGVLHLTGVGFPNGVVSAPVGSIYIDTNVTNGASSWVKKSGTGNTGWQVLEGRVGSTIPGSDLLNGWDYENEVAASMRLSREGNMATLTIPAIGLRGTAATSNLFYLLPQGYRVATAGNYGTLGFINRSNAPVRLTKDFSHITTQLGANVDGVVSWSTNDDWPVSVPGTRVV